jgi:MFS family permease
MDLEDEIFRAPSRAGSQSSKSSKSSRSSKDEAAAAETHASEYDVQNPFKPYSNEDLDEMVKVFADTDPGLRQQVELLKCGARLAKDQQNALSDESKFSGLTKRQREYLETDEKKTSFWGQSKYLKGSLLSACLAGIIQGWTQSAMNGANLGITDQFHMNDANGKLLSDKEWIFGVLNAMPFLAGGLLTPLVSDFLQEHFLGRRGAIAIACILSIAATIGQSFSKSIAQILGCRVITGLTLAAKASTAPLLTAEVAPNHLRGNLLATWQLSDAFGIFLGFSSNLATYHMVSPEKIIWRVQIATILIPTIILLSLVYFMPESPRYLMKHGMQPKALEAFTFVRPSPVSHLLAARDFVYAHFQLEMECKSMVERQNKQKSHGKQANPKQEKGKEKEDMDVSEKEVKNGQEDEFDLEAGGTPSSKTPEKPLYDISRTNYFQRLRQTFMDGRSRRALLCASTAMISQQLTGINTIAFLSTTLLHTTSVSDHSIVWIGFGIGLCNFIFGTPAFWLVDRVGRATMLLLGFVPMFVFMLVLAFSFKGGANDEARVPLVAVFGLLFIIAYSPTAGTSPFAISAEVFPLVVREVGFSLAVAVNFLGLGIVLLFFPSMSNAMGGYKGSLSLFAALNLVALVLCYLFVPETKGRTLEELRSIFDIPTSEHIRYRCKFMAPWLVRNYLRAPAVKFHLWPKPPKPEEIAPGDILGGAEGKGKGDGLVGADEGDQGDTGDSHGLEAAVDLDPFVEFHDWYKANQRVRREMEEAEAAK